MAGGSGHHGDRITQPTGGVGHRELVAGHVAKRAGAEIPPAAVLEGMVEAGPVLPRRGHAEPGLPIDPLERLADLLLLLAHEVGDDLGHLLGGDRRILLLIDLFHRLCLVLADVHPPARPLGPDGAIGPGIDFLERAEHARLELGDRLPRGVERGALVAHLRDHALVGHLLGHLGQQPGLVDRAGERLLRVARDAQPHGLERGRGVHVIGGADGAHVDLLAVLGEEFAEVGEPLRSLKLLRLALALERVAVDVADRDHVAKQGGVVGITASLAPDPDAGHVELLIGRGAPGRAAAGGHEVAGAQQGTGSKKTATRCGGHALFLGHFADEHHGSGGDGATRRSAIG